MIVPSRTEFRSLSGTGKLVPVYRELLADQDTPVSAFRKIDRGPYGFLLESAEGGEKWGRFSLLGSQPSLVFTAHGGRCEIREGDRVTTGTRRPLEELAELLRRHQAVPLPGLPRFCGGAVGYLAHDAARWFEPLPSRARDDLGLPDAVFLFADVACVFDHLTHTLKIVTHARGDAGPDAAYDAAAARIEAEIGRLQSAPPRVGAAAGGAPTEPECSTTAEAFCSAVERAREHIRAGDLCRVFLSHRMGAPVAQPAFEAYRALRMTHPAPYLYFLKLGDLSLAGSSPAPLVRRMEGVIEMRPTSGTRPRGRNGGEEQALEEELRASEAERAEHALLVDLARSDVGRVAEYGTVETREYMSVERHSRVLHLVSSVLGRARTGIEPLDIVRACFPAGVVSGVPRVRAMEVIEELETLRRGIHGGAIGHFDYHGNLDLCVASRTLVYAGGRAHWGVGTAIAADSEPRRAWQETLREGRALWLALERAERGQR